MPSSIFPLTFLSFPLSLSLALSNSLSLSFPNTFVCYIFWLDDVFRDAADEYTKGTDTMDVWFDSGTSWAGAYLLNRINVLKNEVLLYSMNNFIWFSRCGEHERWIKLSSWCLPGGIGSAQRMVPKFPADVSSFHGYRTVQDSTYTWICIGWKRIQNVEIVRYVLTYI